MTSELRETIADIVHEAVHREMRGSKRAAHDAADEILGLVRPEVSTLAVGVGRSKPTEISKTASLTGDNSHEDRATTAVSRNELARNQMVERREAWWNIICQQGDPIRRPNLSFEAYAAGYAAALEAVQYEEVVAEARFLCERLEDFENELTDEHDAREYHGHVRPSLHRLSALLTKMGVSPEGGEK